MIDYRIRGFLAVLEGGTLAKAAEGLGLTQPALSHQLKALEEEFGQPLFYRRGRRLVLSEAGRELEGAAARCLAEERSLRRRLAGFSDGRGRFVLGATLTIGEFILPALLGRYGKARPGRELSVLIENTARVLTLLDQGRIDLALVEGPFDRSRYDSSLFLRDEMIFIAPQGFLTSPQVGPAELAAGRMILREPGSGTRFYWEQYRERHGLAPPPEGLLMELGSLSAVKSLVESGAGCSVMSRRAAEKELAAGSLETAPFAAGPLLRELYFVSNPLSPRGFVEEFTAFCREEAQP